MAAVKLIRVHKELIKELEGEELLECIRKDDLPGTKDRLREVLYRMQQKYGVGGNEQTRKSWKLYRIKLYNNLLLLALGAEDQEMEPWKDSDFITDKATSHLVSGSIYTYLLDQIHEDEEIMFKKYHAQSRSKTPGSRRRTSSRGKTSGKKPSLDEYAYWLVESIRIYRDKILVSPVVAALMEWEEENKEVCKNLLDKAKQVFKDKVSSYGRKWSERSWRNRARLYWLLALAKHAPISDGQMGTFKNYEYSGPIRRLVQEMIKEDKYMLLFAKDPVRPIDYTKEKFDKVKKELSLGNFKICSLLAWASAVNDQDLVECIFEHKKQYLQSVECDWEWEKSWKKAWADALWNAAYKGHEKIVQALLSCKFPYHELYWKYYSKTAMQPPLHVAVRRGHISVVEAFCTDSNTKFSCHDENDDQQTPLEVSTTLEDKVTKKKIQSILLQRSEVKQAVEELSLQRQLTVGSANATMVGAALIAGVTFGGWLQPPLGYDSYYQFPEPLPAPPDTFLSYLSVQGYTSIQVFAIFNSLSFFCAIAAVVAGMETACFIEALEDTYLAKTVENLRYKLKWTMVTFIASVTCVLIAFASAGIAILPPIKRHRVNMYITIALGGFICAIFICRMLLFCTSKHLYEWTTSRFGPMSKWMVGKFWNFLGRGVGDRVPQVEAQSSGGTLQQEEEILNKSTKQCTDTLVEA